MGDDRSVKHKGKVDPLTVLGLEDVYKQINLLETIKCIYTLCVERKVHPHCESETLLTPLVGLVHDAGLKRITKGLREDIYSWILRVLEALLQRIHGILEVWADFRDKNSDGFGVAFFEGLSDEVAQFVPKEIPDFVADANSRPSSSAMSISDSASEDLESSPGDGRRSSTVSLQSMSSKDFSLQSKVTRARRSSTVPKPILKDVEPDDTPPPSPKERNVTPVIEEKVLTRQQKLLDEINETKIKSNVDVGLLMKYYTKKPNVKRYYVEERSPEKDTNKIDVKDVEISQGTQIELQPDNHCFTERKPAMLSADTFSFSSADLYSPSAGHNS